MVIPDPASWVDAYGDELYRYALARTNPEQAEELVQEALLSALEGLANFRGEASERTWLFVILRRKVLDFYRRQARSLIEPLAGAEPEEDAFFDPADGHWRPDAGPRDWPVEASDAALEQREFYETLARCRQQLPARHATVFGLRFLEDYSPEEICKELNLTASNFWVIVHRAKLRLRRCLEAHWFGRRPA